MLGAAALREGLGTRELRLFALISAAMSLSLWAFTVVLAIAAYKAAGTAAVTLAVLARVVPGAVAGPFTALYVDRRSRRTALLALTGAATGVLAALMVATALDGPLALVLVLAAIFSVLVSGQQPALIALLPGLARSPRELAVANSLRQGFGNGAYCLGALAGGTAAAAVSVTAGFAVALAGSLVAVVALAGMLRDPVPAHRAAGADTSVAGELLLGSYEVRTTPELRDAVGVLAVLGLVYGALDVLMVIVAVELVGLGTGGVGILNSAWGAGGIVGGFAALALLGRGRFSSAVDVGAALVCVPLAIVAALAAPAVAIAGFALLGVGYATADTAGQTLVQRLASDETLARAFAVAETSSAVAVALGSVLAPVLIAVLGLAGALVAVALLLPAVAVVRRRALRSLDARTAVPDRELQALRTVDLFAPLPLATVETLALRTLPRVVAADELILRAGDVGDRFYVIADGSVEVQAGEALRHEGPGEYFGEIALLRDVPRTATVVAVTDGLLYALSREDFLRAVTGHARSTHAARSVAEARLRASSALS